MPCFRIPNLLICHTSVFGVNPLNAVDSETNDNVRQWLSKYHVKRSIIRQSGNSKSTDIEAWGGLSGKLWILFSDSIRRRSQLQRGLRRGSAAASLLRLWVRIPLGTRKFVVMCCKVEVSATGWSLVQRSATECNASLCVIYKPCEWGGHGPRWGRSATGGKKLRSYLVPQIFKNQCAFSSPFPGINLECEYILNLLDNPPPDFKSLPVCD